MKANGKLIILAILTNFLSCSIPVCGEDTPSQQRHSDSAIGYAQGVLDAIRNAVPLVERELKLRPKSPISSELEKYLVYLYDQFYLHIHANYSHKEYGVYTEMALEPYFEVIECGVSSGGRDSIMKIIDLDKKAAESAKKFSQSNK